MLRHRVFHLAACLFLVTSTSAADNVVVTSSLHPITYRMIACAPAARSDAARCLADEQTRLDSFVIRDWIRAAAKEYAITLSDDEKAIVQQRVTERHDATVRAAKHFHQVDEFVLRIRRGENRERVIAAAEQAGVTSAEIENHLAALPSVEDVERALSRDPVTDADAAIRRNVTQQFTIAHLKAFIADRSKRQHISFDLAEQQFWSAIIAKIEMRAVDTRYHLPERKGIFDVRQQTVTFHP